MSGCVVLFSGGLDSTAVLYWARQLHSRVLALSFDYGQRHRSELAAASRICHLLNVQHEVLTCKALMEIGGSDLVRPPAGEACPIPDLSAEGATVPGRNLVLLALSGSFAVAHAFDTIAIGCNADDARLFRDCMPMFLTGARMALHYAGVDVDVVAPLMELSKAGVLRQARQDGMTPEVEATTVSCYYGTRGAGCGGCHACKTRAAAVAECS